MRVGELSIIGWEIISTGTISGKVADGNVDISSEEVVVDA